jgi:hypothetical protein
MDGSKNAGRLRGNGNEQQGQGRNIRGHDNIKARAQFIATLFEAAACQMRRRSVAVAP